MDDLVNSGIIGLIDAVEKYDLKRGIKFKTYAEIRIRGAILDSLRSQDWVPRSVRKQKKMLEQSYARLGQEYGRHATEEEVCQNLGMGLTEFYKLLDSLKVVTLGRFIELNPIDHQDDERGDGSIAFIADESTGDPYQCFERHELTEILAGAIKRLPEKERWVVSLYYFDELTMKEIGCVLSVTESRVSQLHTKAMLRLREALKTFLRSQSRG